MMTHEQIQQMFNEDSDDEILVSYTQVQLQGGLLVLKPGASYTPVYTVSQIQGNHEAVAVFCLTATASSFDK